MCAAILSATASVHAKTLERSPERENIVETSDVMREIAEHDKEISDDFVEVFQDDSNKIGRASCMERVYISVVAVSLKNIFLRG